MKGLIIKDLMCLRKQRLIFCYLVVLTLALSVMFVLSSNFGNLSTVRQEMIEMEEYGGVLVEMIANMAMIFFMMLPLALTGEVTSVFIYDGKAEFAKVSSSLPVTLRKRVLAKYIAAFSMLFIGAVIDLALAFILSLLTDIVSFSEFFGIIVTASSIFLIYGGLTVFFCFCFGYGKEQYAQIVSILIMLAVFFACNFSKIKQAFLSDVQALLLDTYLDALDMIKHQFYIPFVIAIFVLLASYFGSVAVAERKRGMI